MEELKITLAALENSFDTVDKQNCDMTRITWENHQECWGDLKRTETKYYEEINQSLNYNGFWEIFGMENI